MFLRRHTKLVGQDVYTYWSLIKSIRTAKGSRHQVVAHLGKLTPDETQQAREWSDLDALLDGTPPAQQLPLNVPPPPPPAPLPADSGCESGAGGTGAAVRPGVSGAGVVANAGTMDSEQGVGHVCATVVEGTGRTTLDGRGVTDGHGSGIAVAGGGATRKRAGATAGALGTGPAETAQDPAECSAENRPPKVTSACKSSQPFL